MHAEKREEKEEGGHYQGQGMQDEKEKEREREREGRAQKRRRLVGDKRNMCVWLYSAWAGERDI